MEIEEYEITGEVPMPFNQAAHRTLIDKVRAWFRGENLHDPNDSLWVCYALVYLYSRQTRAEQNSDETIRKNGVGFTTCDAVLF